MNSFLQGLIAGYGIAIPLGAIGVLIVQTAMRRGFKLGFYAGAGAATADFLYAVLASVAGGMIGVILSNIQTPLRIASGSVLAVMGIWGIYGSVRHLRKHDQLKPNRTIVSTNGAAVYAQFVGMTILNPLTIVYFSALILGKTTSHPQTMATVGLFVIGAGLASFSWHSLIAAIGAIAHRTLPAVFQHILGILGGCIVMGLGIKIIY